MVFLYTAICTISATNTATAAATVCIDQCVRLLSWMGSEFLAFFARVSATMTNSDFAAMVKEMMS
jgi:hypothetical protein